MSSKLFSPFAIRGAAYANRIAVSPMAQYKGDNGSATRWHDQHLGSFAASNPGLVFFESTSVEREGWGSLDCLALHSDEHETAIRQVLDNIRTYSETPFAIQFGHSGRKGSGKTPAGGRGPLPVEEGGWPVWGPSEIAYADGHPTPVAFGDDDLDRVRESYRQAAERVNRLDLTLVELHGAHGYLLHTFMSPLSNQRADAYGGTLKKRTAFVAEIVEIVRRELHDDRVLGIRLNAHDYVGEGTTFEDTIEIVKILRDAGLDYVCVSAGAITNEAKIEQSPGYLVPFASDLKKATNIHAFVTGMIIQPHQAEEVIADGHADMVEIARGFLDDPRWVWHAAESLGVELDFMMQYWMAKPGRWPGAGIIRGTVAAE